MVKGLLDPDKQPTEMTVQDLIDVLSAVEDKRTMIFVNTGFACGGITNDFQAVADDDGDIILTDVR